MFLTSSNSPKKSTSSSTTTTTVATPLDSDATLQAAANKVAVAAGCPASTSARVNTQKYSAAPPMTIDTAKTYTATVKTTTGTFTIALDAKAAPVTVNSFVFLADKGYFHCVIFHRVIPGFVDQTGDPTGTGTGGPGYEFADENIPEGLRHRGSWPWPTPAARTPTAASSSSWRPAERRRSTPTSPAAGTHCSARSHRGQNVVNTINNEGSTAAAPPT